MPTSQFYYAISQMSEKKKKIVKTFIHLLDQSFNLTLCTPLFNLIITV